jgi:phosphoadenylyl-sulfate reductase (thioredoxin)
MQPNGQETLGDLANQQINEQVLALRAQADGRGPGAIVRLALETWREEVAIAFSGAEDVLLIELASQTGLPFRVFALDTGRLHPQTYRFFAEVEAKYRIRIEYCFPDATQVESLVRHKGLFSFLEDGHTECCQIRKVAPLRRHLRQFKAWITGQRRDQSVTRKALEVFELDTSNSNESGVPLVKVNPLAGETADYVWASIEGFQVPFNPLHLTGMRSIGCEPCTRPILPHQHEREGRWWWERENDKECGLHKA